jgi:hypothetical protein
MGGPGVFEGEKMATDTMDTLESGRERVDALGGYL